MQLELTENEVLAVIGALDMKIDELTDDSITAKVEAARKLYKEDLNEAEVIRRYLRAMLKGNENNNKSPGQLAYEEDVRRHPLYDDKTPRREWATLGSLTKETWEKDPTPREWKVKT